MEQFQDQMGNILRFDSPPRRIVSLVPSQSEFLWDIGLRPVGITKFCLHPEEMFRTVDRVGGTKDADLEKIRRLRPDLVIGNKEENDPVLIARLQQEFKVWMSDVRSLEDAFSMMSGLSAITGRKAEGDRVIRAIRTSLGGLEGMFKGQRVAYFIWNRPYMVAARDTFIHALLEYLGFENCFSAFERYPQVRVEELQRMKPEFCMLSSEPYPFKERHAQALRDILPESRILFVDGEMFSWYGSRLLGLPAYVTELKFSMRI